MAIAPPELTSNSGGFVIGGPRRYAPAVASGRDTDANFAQIRPFRGRVPPIPPAAGGARRQARAAGADRRAAPRGAPGSGGAGLADPPVHEHGDVRIRPLV